jgi:hypothetical protein
MCIFSWAQRIFARLLKLLYQEAKLEIAAKKSQALSLLHAKFFSGKYVKSLNEFKCFFFLDTVDLYILELKARIMNTNNCKDLATVTA